MQRTALAPILSLLALAACDPDAQFRDPSARNDALLERFSTCGAMEVGLTDAYTEELVSWRYGYYYDVMLEDGAPADSDGASGSPSDFSTTNTQESTVDEPDIVKTNGNYVYVIDPSWAGNNTIHIVKSWPIEDTEEVGSIELEGYPYSMFLQDDTLVAYSYVYDLPTDDPSRYGYGTRISIIDVSDPENPEELRQIDLEGSLTSARGIGSDIYTVVNTYAYTPQSIYDLSWDETLGLPDNTDYWSLSEAEQEAMRIEARRIWRPLVQQKVREIGAENLLPRKWDHLPGEIVDAEPIGACSDVYHPQGISRPSMLTVAHLALDDEDGSDLSTTTLMADGWTVYASETSLYVAQSSWWWWWGWGAVDQTTHIHKFDLAGANTTYVASGEIDGWINNQFSFSELDGFLRVATSDFWSWGCWGDACEEDTAAPANNVFVLQQNESALEVVGALTGIAPEEQIYATRFVGDIGFMVTFQQTDPLFTIDLSDPTSPELIGELVMPGYSGYLHPLSNGNLLAVGMAGEEDGTITGLKVSLFDVSDLENPSIADEIEVSTGDYSYSEALWDHRAFTYHRNNLSLPIYSYDWNESDGTYGYFSGILSIDVNEADGTLEEVGRISHQDLVDDSVCLWDDYYAEWGYDTGVDSYCANDWYWYASVRRSVVIEDNLLSISDYGIKVTDLADPTDVIATVLFYPAE